MVLTNFLQMFEIKDGSNLYIIFGLKVFSKRSILILWSWKSFLRHSIDFSIDLSWSFCYMVT
jgi:hypothetical protein